MYMISVCIIRIRTLAHDSKVSQYLMAQWDKCSALPAVRDTKVLPGVLKEVPMDSFQMLLHRLLLKSCFSTKFAAKEWFTRITRAGVAT